MTRIGRPAFRKPGLAPGSKVRLRGAISISKTGAVMINPAYELTD